MNAPSYIPSFYFYKFAQGLSAPYSSLQAYQSGIIDESGNIVKPESSIDPLEYLIIKLKKIFEELPSGMTKAQLGNYLSTMKLFGESVESFGITKAEYTGLLEGHFIMEGYPQISLKNLFEDMGAAGMAAPASSPGYNTGNVSGMDPVMAPMQRRQKPVKTGLDACEMFDVCPEELQQFKNASDWRYVPEGPTKKYIRRYQLRNPSGSIALRSVDPDTNEASIHWLSFKPKKLKEETEMLEESRFTPTKAAKRIISLGAEQLIKSHEGKTDVDPQSGKPKQGGWAQRFGDLSLWTHNLMTSGNAEHQGMEEFAGRSLGREVFQTGVDTWVHDPKTGLLKPADIKAHNTTVFGHINPEEYGKYPGLGKTMELLQQIALKRKKGGLTKTEKSKFRDEAEAFTERNAYRTRMAEALLGKLHVDQGTHWGVVRGTGKSGPSRRTFPYSGALTIVSPQAIEDYARTITDISPRLDIRFGVKENKQGAGAKIRGRDISVAEVARQFEQHPATVSVAGSDLMAAWEASLPRQQLRRMQAILRTRGAIP